MFNGPLSEALHRALELRGRVAPLMLLRRNVVGVGVGYKIRGREITGEPSIMVSVTRKQPISALDPDDLVPAEVQGVPTDVVQTGQIVAFSPDRHTRQRPIRPGLSIGHPAGSAGTLGAIVQRDGDLFILSNNHVMASLNQARPGDPILQPGPADGGTLFDQIASLETFQPLRFLDELAEPVEDDAPPGRGWMGALARLIEKLRSGRPLRAGEPPPLLPPTNRVDAALARLHDSVPVEPAIIDVEGLPAGVLEPELGMRVIKSGRTTGLTRAQIVQIDVTIDVQYGARTARFTNQVMTGALSDRGDSGSLVLDYRRNAVGLLFSGSGTVSVVNPIQPVLKAFEVELVTERMV